MCNQESETAAHLILHCNFARQVWDKMENWTQHLVQLPGYGLEVMEWWEKGLAHLPKKTRRLKAALMIYCAWNIWKARNRKVFDNKSLTPAEVLQEIKAEVHCRTLACGRSELSSFNV
jgi:hypothetical protein